MLTFDVKYLINIADLYKRNVCEGHNILVFNGNVLFGYHICVTGIKITQKCKMHSSTSIFIELGKVRHKGF